LDKFRYRHIIQIIILFGLIAITAVLFFPVQRFIASRMDDLKRTAIERIETVLGRHISYEKLSPSLFMHLKIEGLTVYSDGPGGPALVEIRRVRVYYRLFKLLSNNPGDAIHEVRIENTRLALDLERDRELISLIEDLVERAQRPDGETVLPDVTVSGKNLDISLSSPDFEASAADLFFTFEAGRENYGVDARGRIDLTLEDGPWELSKVSTSVDLSGRVGSSFEWADLNVGIDRFTSNLADLAEQQFYITLDEETVVVRKTQDKAPLDLRIAADLSGEEVILSLRTEEFTPQTIISAEGEAGFLGPWLSTVISGTLEASYRFPSKEFVYSADLALRVNETASPIPFDAVVKAEGDLETVEMELVRISSDRGTAEYSGRFDFESMLPEGIFRFRSVPVLSGQTASGTLAVRRETDRVRIVGSGVRLGDTELEEFHMMLQPLEGAVRFTLDAAMPGPGQNRIVSDGSVQYDPDLLLDLNLRIADVSSSSVAEVLFPADTVERIPPGLLELTVDSQIFVTTDLVDTAYLLPNFQMYQSGNPENMLSFNAAGNQNGLEISDISLMWNEYTMDGGLTALIGEGNNIEANTEFSVNGIPYTLSGILLGTGEILVNGSYATVMTLQKNEERYDFRLKTGSVPIPLKDKRGRVDLDIYGFYETASAWQVYFDSCRIAKFNLGPIQGADVTVSISADQETLLVHDIDYKDTFSRVNGSGRFSYRRGGSFALDGWLHLNSLEDAEQYISVVSLQDGNIEGSVRVRDIPLERFLRGRNVRGLLGGLVRVSGPVKDPGFEIYLRTEDTLYNNDPVSLELSGALTGEELDIGTLDLRYLNNRILFETGIFDFSRGSFDFRGEYTGSFQNEVLRADLSLSGETKRRGDRSKLPHILRGDIAGTGRILTPTFGNRELEPWTVDFDKSDESVRILGGPRNALNAKFQTTGSFEVKLSKPLPATLYAKGVLAKGTIEADLKSLNLDFDALNTFLNIPFFHIVEGQGFGDLRITGPFNDPDFYGTLQLLGAVAENPLIPEDLGPFSTGLVFDGKLFSIDDVSINAGSGKVTVDADFVMDHWVPRQYSIRVVTEEGRALPIAGNFAGVVVDGFALGNISIDGDFSGVDIAGDLRIVDADVTLGEREEAPPRNRPFDFRTDMTITTGRRVDFQWPAGNFPILRTSAEVDESVRITFNSGSGEYEVKGEIGIRGGQIFYFSRNFYLREGAITFNETTGRFDPRLTVRADIRDVTPDGEDVTISLIVDNNPLSQFSPRFESDPVLPNTEILALLGQNVITDLGGEEIRLSSAIAMTGGIVLNQFGFFRSFEEAVKDIFRLDLFSIRTQMLENLLVESIFGPEAQEGTTVTTLSRYLDNTTLFLGKYLSDDIFIEAMVGLRVRNMNLEEESLREEFVVDTEISLEWKTPLALLEFSFMPNMTDLFGKPPIFSLALSWGFSF
jgi:translocation and assembly module TamB